MIKILSKCTLGDFEYLSEALDSTLSFTDDKGRKEMLEAYRANPSEENKSNLVMKFDHQIRYFASANAAILFRQVIGSGGEVSANEMIIDVADKLKVQIVPFGSIESKLGKLVKAVVEKEFVSKSPEELAAALNKLMLKPEVIDEVMKETAKIGPVAVLPILIRILGPKVALPIIESIIASLVSQLIGIQAGTLIAKEFVKRNPFFNALGPIFWTVSAVWLAFDLQSAAYSKTVPVCLYLGLVSLRDRGEDGEDLWQLFQNDK